jgi:hypothetical protein
MGDFVELSPAQADCPIFPTPDISRLPVYRAIPSDVTMAAPALAGLAIAANVFQVISFSDTVFRAGRSLYELFDRIRSASRNVGLLLLEFRALLSVIASVRMVITEHASSPFAQDYGYMLSDVNAVLTLVEQDFRHLKGFLLQYTGFSPGGWLSRMQSNIFWGFKDSEIEASRHRLARYTQSLTAAMSVTGRYAIQIAHKLLSRY